MEKCKHELVCDNISRFYLSSSDYSYLSEIDRGGLQRPKTLY